MTNPTPLVPGFARRRLACALAFFCLLAAAVAATPAAKRLAFDIPSATAPEALKRFAAQAGIQVLYAVDIVDGVKTNPVKGELTPREAIDRMLAGTALAAQQTAGGAIAVRKENAGPNVPGAALVTPSVRPPAAERAKRDDTLVMSPFEVVSEARGYHGANTTSGTRINSKLEDLASSISIVTKEQMSDFALLDINDIFNYEASTEGTGNFTDVSFDRNGMELDNVQLNPGGANRIRGLNAANITFGNFETSGRVPLDPLNIDAIEISRGPNSSIFGIGSSSGTVNSVPASALLHRDKSQFSARVDSYGGHRTTIDLNRVLKPGVLAVRGSAAYQHDAFQRKPSGIDSVRLNGMVKVQPFRRTTLTASYSSYEMHGTRPNSSPPRDAISGWLRSGSPTWDPVARTVKINGAVVGSFTGTPTAYFAPSPGNANSLVYVDRSGIGFWGTSRPTMTTNPTAVTTGTGVIMIGLADPDGFLARQPLFVSKPVIDDKSYYDWSKINLASANRVEDNSGIGSVSLDQTIFETPRQMLAVQGAWFRETNQKISRLPMSDSSASGALASAQPLQVDVNERLLDGSLNPYFLRPFISSALPRSAVGGMDRNIYRAQLAYRLDFRQEKNPLHWLGLHQLSGYYEYKRYEEWNRSYRESILDDHTWMPAGSQRGVNAGVLAIGVGYYNFYLGDNQGHDVDYGSTTFQQGTYTMTYGNPVTGATREPVLLGSAINQNTGTLSLLKARGAVLQSFFLKERVVTTLGWRHDARYSRSKQALRLTSDGINVDPRFDRWVEGDWGVGQGFTSTAGVVVKPLNWLHLYANKSNAFQPASPALDMYLRRLPDPRGEGEDHGIVFNLFDGKLSIRANQYTTTQKNSRNGESATLATRLQGVDFQWRGAATYKLQYNAELWAQAEAVARGQVLTQTQLDTRVADIMKVPVELLYPMQVPLSAADLIVAKGKEIEIHFNPTSYWTTKLNLVEQKSTNAKLAAEVGQWLEERLAVWTKIIDPTINRPWFTERYDNRNSAAQFLASDVLTQLAVARALEGKSRPQVRRYRINASTNFKLAGITDHRWLKRFSVGGALRWEDKGGIGYSGVERLPAVITMLDPSHPIYDQAHLYVDALASYRMRMFRDKIASAIQLNVRNVTEGGRLQPIAANPDGSPSAFRIIDPRQFILSLTFDL
jgi:outer membrane receptor protein involved in Fe transport